MLYDHGLVRKSVPFEGSAGIPLFLRLPWALRQGRAGITDGRLAELRDVLPTLCDICGIDIPPGLDGHSLLDPSFTREYLHGEHTNGILSNHWITDGKEKYCWFSQSGKELLFDLHADPCEMHDLSRERPDRTEFWRKRLAEELTGRIEEYVQDGILRSGRPPLSSQPWAGIGKGKGHLGRE